MSNITVKELFNKYGRCIKKNSFMSLYPPIICNDGYFISVQASRFHLCEPAETLETFEYEAVEVRCSERDAADLEGFKMDSPGIYSRVPVEIVEAIVIKHGGIDENAIKDTIDQENK